MPDASLHFQSPSASNGTIVQEVATETQRRKSITIERDLVCSLMIVVLFVPTPWYSLCWELLYFCLCLVLWCSSYQALWYSLCLVLWCSCYCREPLYSLYYPELSYFWCLVLWYFWYYRQELWCSLSPSAETTILVHNQSCRPYLRSFECQLAHEGAEQQYPFEAYPIMMQIKSKQHQDNMNIALVRWLGVTKR